MLHYIHKLDTNSIYLPFGAGQVVYRWVFQVFFLLKSDVCCVRNMDMMKALGLNKHGKVAVNSKH